MIYQVWREGYQATGESDVASFLGQTEAETFAEACAIVCKNSGWKVAPGGFDPVGLSVWGCRLYDNEDHARRTFG